VWEAPHQPHDCQAPYVPVLLASRQGGDRMSPPERDTGPTPETGTHQTPTTKQRNGHRRQDGYEDAVMHLLGCGMMPAANVDGLRLMWKRGGHSRRAAQLVAEWWGLAG
jgi:hypothetical protein